MVSPAPPHERRLSPAAPRRLGMVSPAPPHERRSRPINTQLVVVVVGSWLMVTARPSGC